MRELPEDRPPRRNGEWVLLETDSPEYMDLMRSLRCPRCGRGATEEVLVRRDGSRHSVFICYEETGCFTHYDVYEGDPA